MPDEAFTSGEGSDEVPAKENFIGEVVFSNVDCTCEDCESGREGAARKGLSEEEMESDYDHFMKIRPLTEYTDTNAFHVYNLNVNDNFNSKWMVMVGHLERVHGNLREAMVDQGYADSVSDVALDTFQDFLTGRVYEFREITWEEDEEFSWPGTDVTRNIGNMFDSGDFAPNSMLVPIDEITDDNQLADLGVEGDTGEVEEIDI